MDADEAYADDETPDAEPQENEEAWTIENAGAVNEDVYSEEEPESEDEIFEGGFAGKCPEEQAWQFEDPGEWRCSGSVPWQQAVVLPEIENPNSETYIGMLVMPYNDYSSFQDLPEHVPDEWMSFSQATDHAEHTDTESLGELEATCWPGEVEDREEQVEEEENYIQASVSPSDGEPFGIYGEVDMDDEARYSCNWNYDGVEDTGDLVLLHRATGDNSIEDAIIVGEDEDSVEEAEQVQSDFTDEHGFELSYTSNAFRNAMQDSGWDVVEAN